MSMIDGQTDKLVGTYIHWWTFSQCIIDSDIDWHLSIELFDFKLILNFEKTEFGCIHICIYDR